MKVNSNSFSLLAGWVIDGSGGPVRRHVLIRVSEGRITAREEPGELDPLDPHVVNLQDCTLIPGLIDAHVHLFLSGTLDPAVRQKQLMEPFANVRPVIARHLRNHAGHGVVAVRDGGDVAGHALRFKGDCLQAENIPVVLKSPGKAWRAHGRYGRLIGRPPNPGETLAQAIDRARGSADHVKIVNSGLTSLKLFAKESEPQFTSEALARGVGAAHRIGLKTMIHANGERPVRMIIEARGDSVEHGFFMGKDNLRRMAEAQVTWVPTAVTMQAYRNSLPTGTLESDVAGKNLEHQLHQISLAMEYGVPLAVGTDAGSPGVDHGSGIIEEIRLLLEAGFSLQGALRCATAQGACLLGLEKDLGLLVPGMEATFLAVRGSPSHMPGSLNSPASLFVRGHRYDPGAPHGAREGG